MQTSTFVVNQTEAKVAHPFDLDSDDSSLKFSKKENTRFYQIYNFGMGNIQVSHEITTVKDRHGRVIAGTFRKRIGGNWTTMKANTSKMYAVIRRRAAHSDNGKSFVRYITFLMSYQRL